LTDYYINILIIASYVFARVSWRHWRRLSFPYRNFLHIPRISASL